MDPEPTSDQPAGESADTLRGDAQHSEPANAPLAEKEPESGEPQAEGVMVAEVVSESTVTHIGPAVKITFKSNPIAALIRRFGLGAFTTSLLVHLVFLALAFFSLYKWIYPPEEKVDFLPGGGGGGQGGSEVHKVQTSVRQRMASAAVPSTRIASTSSTAAFSLPNSTNNLLDSGLPMDLGSGSGGGEGGGFGGGQGSGIGQGLGKGFGDGQLGIGALIPTIMKGRCSDAERLRMLREAGGTTDVEEAVKKSLAWFKKHQNKDGSWGDRFKPAMTGLALLCFLGHCESAQSGEYGQSVFEGIIFLIDVASKNNGIMQTSDKGNAGSYEHAIATYALSEALCYSRSLQFPLPELEPTVLRAAEIIIQGQTNEGGWDYLYANKGRNDLSVAGWQLQALKAARFSGVKLEGLDVCIRKATEWLEKTAYVGDGKFAYTGSGPHPGMTAVGALCLQQLEKGSTKPVREAIKLMHDGLRLRPRREKPQEPPAPQDNKAKDDKAKDDKAKDDKAKDDKAKDDKAKDDKAKDDKAKDDKAKDEEKSREEKKLENDYAPLYSMHYNSNADLYAWYYMVQAMRNAGGEEWERTNKAILEEIVPMQNPDGSFKFETVTKPLGHVNTKSQGQVFNQALNTLILEVYYRFLPATSAGKGHKSEFDNVRGLR